jgi:hypothetical protein
MTKFSIAKRIFKIGAAVFVAYAALSIGRVAFTNSFYTATADVSGTSFSAGWWVPELSMSYAPNKPDGQNDFYATSPCVTLTADIHGDPSGAEIYYKFSNDGDPAKDGKKYDGKCVTIPDGDSSNFEAVAVNSTNSSWKSEIVSQSFKVDTIAPSVEITAPENNSDVSGTVKVRGTVTDANPDHYWLVIENSSGHQVAGPGTVSDSSSFTDKTLIDGWDTTQVPDGEYTIKLEARDAAGNKVPNEDPVVSDPNVAGDSVDWIKVNVKNDPNPGDVVINEIMWAGSAGGSGDEWIELRNMTSHDIDISNWRIDGAGAGNGSHVEIPNDYSIKAHGYFLIMNNKWNDSAIKLDSDLDKDEGMTNVSGMNLNNNGEQLTLKDKDRHTIDTAWKDGSKWPAGSSGSVKESMERNDNPGNGVHDSSWHTCALDGMSDSDRSTMESYWNSGAQGKNCGTPEHENLSGNDPTDKNSDDSGKKDQVETVSVSPAPKVIFPDEPSVEPESGGPDPNPDNSIATNQTNSAAGDSIAAKTFDSASPSGN